jgi:hypothetical protein
LAAGDARRRNAVVAKNQKAATRAAEGRKAARAKWLAEKSRARQVAAKYGRDLPLLEGDDDRWE